MNEILIVAALLCSSDADYKEFYARTEASFTTWSKDHADGDKDKFIQERMMQLNPSLDDEKSIRVVVYWLAYCKDCSCTPPSQVSQKLSTYADQVSGIKTWSDLFAKIREVQANTKKLAESKAGKDIKGM